MLSSLSCVSYTKRITYSELTPHEKKQTKERTALAEVVAEVAGRLGDTAEKLDEHGRRSRELAEEGLEEIRRQQRWFEEMDQRSEARLVSQEAGRTARLVSREARRSEREHAQATRQDKEAAAAAKEVRRTLLELLQMSDHNE